MKKRILVVGSLNMDMVIEMKSMPLIGETVLGDTLKYVPGGKGGNQAYAVGSLGGEASLLGCVGADAFGSRLVENIRACKVDVSAVDVDEEEPTGTAVIYVDEEGNNSIVVAPGANSSCNVELLQKKDELFQMNDFMLFQMEIPLEAVFYGIRKAKEYEKTVILNPAPAPEDTPDDIWERIDYLTPNETEVLKLCGEPGTSMEHIKKSAKRILAKGVKNVIVTLGDKGVFFVNNNEEHLFEARKVDAIDTTAAGDCFNGAFAVGLSKGMTVCEAIGFANVASSVAVQRKGAQSSIPKWEEVESVWKESFLTQTSGQMSMM